MNRNSLKKILFKSLKIISKSIAVLLLLILLAVALLNIPVVQTYVTQKVTQIISDDYGVDVEVGGVMLAIPNTVRIHDVFVPGQNGDTLLFLGTLKADVSLFRLLNNHVVVRYFSLSDLKADVHRGPPGEGFNFDFILEAFAPDSTTNQEPDTAPSKPWRVSIDLVELQNIDAAFRDETAGMDANLNLGNLDVYVDDLDFSDPGFMVDRILLEDTKIKYEEWNVGEGANKESEIVELSEGKANSETQQNFPGLGLNELSLKNVQIDYLQNDSKLNMHFYGGNIMVEPGENDLNRQQLSIDNIFMGQTIAMVSVASDTSAVDSPSQNTQSTDNQDLKPPYPFLPGWDISVGEVNLEEVTLGFDDISVPAVDQGMDFAHLLFEDVSLAVHDIKLKDDLGQAAIQKLSLRENSGLAIDDFMLEMMLTPEGAAVNGLALNMDDFELLADLNVGFDGFDEAFQNPEHLQTDVNLRIRNLSPVTFQAITGPVLPDSGFTKLQHEKINFALRAKGSPDSLYIARLKMNTLSQTLISASGSVFNLSRPEALFFDLAADSIITGRADLKALTGKMIPENIHLPEVIKGNLIAKGSMQKANATLGFTTSLGNFETDLFYATATQRKPDSVAVQLTLDRLNLGEILENRQLGEVNMVLSANGSGLEIGHPNARLFADVFQSEFNNYVYETVRLEANIQDSLVWLKVLSDDEHADFAIELEAKADSTIQDLNLKLMVEHADLHQLNFTDESFIIETEMQLTGYYKSINDLAGDLLFDNTRLIRRDVIIPIKKIHFRPVFNHEGTFLKFSSGIVNFDFDSNVEFSQFEPLFRSAFNQYLGQASDYDINPDSRFNFSASINLNEDFRSYFIPELNEISLNTINGRYSGRNNDLNLQFHAPMVSYGDIKLHDLYIELEGMHDTITLDAGFQKMYYDSLSISNFRVIENLKSGDILSEISITSDSGQLDYQFLNHLKYANDSLHVSFEEDGLTLNGRQWSVIPGNELLISDSAIISKDFIFTEGDQKIAFYNADQVGSFVAEQFKLQNLLAIFKSPQHEGIVKGNLNLEFTVPHKKQFEGIGVDLSINDLYVFDSLIGNITFNMEERVDKLQMEMRLDNKENWLHGSGTLGKDVEDQPVDVDVDFEISNPARFESLTFGYLSGLSGKISGDMKITGNISQPEIAGKLGFDETRMTIDPLNLQLYMPNESIQLTKSGIKFDDFKIFDNNQNKLNIDGSLFTADLENPAFDLHITSNNFQPVNSTKSDNNIFYGSLVMDADVKLKGDADLPVINADLAIKGGTDLTYVLPGSEIEMVSSEGIVNFINPVYDDDSLQQPTGGEYITDSILSKFTGMDLNAKLELNPEAKFTLVIDPFSGDYSSVQGSAVMNYSIDQSGSQSLTGIFEVTKGVYQLSFYGLVKKTFDFQPGSSIAWSGRPMDANINFTAKHVVRTQSVALVANESTGMTEAEKNMFKQRLPYEVLLNLNGFIDEPDVSFRIELPEKYQLNYPQITSKLNMLNSGQNNSDLNKQVFALLVSGSFIADNPFASSGGSYENFATTAARNSVNGILAQQLNNISNRYIKGVDMNFGLTTYDDYSGGGSETRTELDVQVSKKLLDERLTVEASGSFDLEGNRQYSGTNTSHTYGEFSATYDLTESREYKLRAYRENAYDLFDGEVAYSGIAFIIEKSFNKLFKRTKKEGNTEKEQIENPQPKNGDREGNE